jgi:hypothetical protein
MERTKSPKRWVPRLSTPVALLFLFGFTGRTGVDRVAFLSWNEMCETDLFVFFFYSLPSHDRILDDATYAYAVADAHLDVPLLHVARLPPPLLLNARLQWAGVHFEHVTRWPWKLVRLLAP